MASKATKSKQIETGAQEDRGGGEPAGRVTKSEAVRRALAQGIHQPADGVAYIKDQFGLELKPQHFSAVKSTHLKKGKMTVKVKGRPKKDASTSGATAPKAHGEKDLLMALEAIKPLVSSLGADRVKRLVDLLG